MGIANKATRKRATDLPRRRLETAGEIRARFVSLDNAQNKGLRILSGPRNRDSIVDRTRHGCGEHGVKVGRKLSFEGCSLAGGKPCEMVPVISVCSR